MDLLDILTPECVKAPLVATDKRGVIDELVDVLASVGKATDPQSLKDAVWAREETRTTGIGYSLAIPHGKCSGVSDLAMAIGKPSEPVDFNSIDRKPVKLIVLLASPVDRTSDHIQALARISRLMTQETFREKIYLAGSPQEIYDLLAEQEKALAESAAT